MLIVVTALISKLSVNLLLIDISKEKLFSSAIFYLSSVERIFHGLHNSLCNNNIVVGS